MSNHTLQLVECPRDAMQGLPYLIPTQKKIDYFNALLQVGFHTLDFGSFVSKKAVPQLADTAEVLTGLQRGESNTKLLVIVAAVKGALEAVSYQAVDVLGYPFSVSPTFQLKNTRQTLDDSLDTVNQIKEACHDAQKDLVVYLSMSFGNPYGDEYSHKIVLDQIESHLRLGIKIIALADTVGQATPKQVYELTSSVIQAFPEAQFGLHLHGGENNWQEKVKAGFDAGCTRFDGALGGFGGCPFTGSERVGNLDTINLFSWFDQQHLETGINQSRILNCAKMATQLFA